MLFIVVVIRVIIVALNGTMQIIVVVLLPGIATYVLRVKVFTLRGIMKIPEPNNLRRSKTMRTVTRKLWQQFCM
jgi:hypothetical protein